MNDRFKFRAWHKPTEKMFDVYILTPSLVCKEGAWNTNNSKPIEDCILMQCTGLKDKNGKLIYEGDIVEYHLPETKIFLSQYEVIWLKSSALYALRDKTGKYKVNPFDTSGYEIIGNIYENPELLKGVKNDKN